MIATLWRSALTGEEYGTLVEILETIRNKEEGRPDILLKADLRPDRATRAPQTLDPAWLRDANKTVLWRSGTVHQMAYFPADPAIDVLLVSVEPMLTRWTSPVFPGWKAGMAHIVFQILLLRARTPDPGAVMDVYRGILNLYQLEDVEELLREVRGPDRYRDAFVDVITAALARHPGSAQLAGLLGIHAPSASARPLLETYLVVLELVALELDDEDLRRAVGEELWHAVREIEPLSLAEIAREDQLLFRRARRLIGEHHPYADLPWPDTDASP